MKEEKIEKITAILKLIIVLAFLYGIISAVYYFALTVEYKSAKLPTTEITAIIAIGDEKMEIKVKNYYISEKGIVEIRTKDGENLSVDKSAVLIKKKAIDNKNEEVPEPVTKMQWVITLLCLVIAGPIVFFIYRDVFDWNFL